jgi:hypothetical protein
MIHPSPIHLLKKKIVSLQKKHQTFKKKFSQKKCEMVSDKWETSWEWWFIFIILDAGEAEIRRLEVQDQPGQKSF